jgi:EpsG family
MWIYAIVLSIVGLCALLSLSLPRASPLRPALLPATVLVLALFMGLRDRVGADWNTYQSIFDMYAHADLRNVLTTVPIEPAYAVLNYGSHLVGGGVYLVNWNASINIKYGALRSLR